MTRLAGCWGAGLNQRKNAKNNSEQNALQDGERFDCQIEEEVPRGGKTNVVVRVVIRPVVDIETLRVEVTDIGTRAVRSHKVACFYPSHWKLRFTSRQKQDYILSFLYFIREQPLNKLRTSPLKTSKKFNLYPCSHAIVIRGQRYSGEVSKTRRLRGEAVTAPALADIYKLIR